MIPPTKPLRARPALGLAVIAALMIVAALTMLAVTRGDDGGEVAASISGELPGAPWRAAAVPRDAAPPAYVTAWDQAGNKATCSLLFPLDGGPEMQGAGASADRTPNDNGWDIFLTSGGASIEVLGLFDKATQVEEPAGFTRTWADGSVARYRADVGSAAPGTFDPNSSPFEAVLTLRDQACAYRIYDTLGKDHLESTFDRLRLLGP